MRGRKESVPPPPPPTPPPPTPPPPSPPPPPPSPPPQAPAPPPPPQTLRWPLLLLEPVLSNRHSPCRCDRDEPLVHASPPCPPSPIPVTPQHWMHAEEAHAPGRGRATSRLRYGRLAWQRWTLLEQVTTADLPRRSLRRRREVRKALESALWLWGSPAQASQNPEGRASSLTSALRLLECERWLEYEPW